VPVEEMLIKSNIRDYPVVFTADCIFLSEIKAKGNCAFIVDERVWEYHAGGCLSALRAEEVMILPISEERKRLESVIDLYDGMMERTAKRNMTLVSIGGGIAQDITGFLASTLYRGINWVFVPTTLLAQADSCIGSKTSLNYKNYKNLLGTFYPPTAVYIHAPFLATQKEIDYYSGMGEVVKLHIMGGQLMIEKIVAAFPKLYNRDPAALIDTVQSSLYIKQGYIESDEFDSGRRNLLNFGHCFGHAIESATDFAVPHGQAVVIGILLANEVAVARGLLSEEHSRYLATELLLPTLRLDLASVDLKFSDVIDAMKQDKKRTGEGLALVMVIDGYKMVKVSDLSDDEAVAAMSSLGLGSRGS
jgi:3-dehydroquinate synthase